MIPPADGSPRTNVQSVQHRVQIHDLRSLSKNEYGLDISGFGFEKLETVMKEEDWADDEKIKQSYYPEVIQSVPPRSTVLIAS
jgi:hypothetical protein